ncbi:MAG TPA: methylenetetrahydrofolate reductase [NAD(P)H] [Thiothrix sp.]|nr:methylenetetrahydrofolate reductase [NAD(P)H] [Thiothrix sp.]
MSKKSFSFEFFPPKTDKGIEKLKTVSQELAELNPEFFSVTYGAGGSTQNCTLDTVIDMQKNSGIETAPHLSCIGSSETQIRDILTTYKNSGVKRIVALRGDLPSGMQDIGEFHYANELVAFIRQETGDHFHIEVAAYPEMHPQATNFDTDLQHFVGKIKAGANSAITQYFYNNDAYFRFVDNCAALGIDAPIIPGIMPITNFTQLARFSDATGAEIPRWLRKRLEGYGDDLESIQKLGQDVVTELCTKLIEQGAPGLHFYSMNRTDPSRTICQALDLSSL